MKSTIFSVLTLMSFAAGATPKVGEYSNYLLTFNLNGQESQGMMTLEYLKEDTTTGQFLKKQTLAFAGSNEKHESEDWIGMDSILDDQEIDTIVANCVEAGGTYDSVPYQETTLSACALNHEDEEAHSTIWISKVPFGFAKLVRTNKEDQMVTTLHLSNYKE